MTKIEKWPNLFVVGAVKSGTTSLWAYLKQHPEIYFPELKEPHFFTHPQPAPEQRHCIRYIDSEDNYLRLYQGVDKVQYLGDASPSYLWSEIAAREIAQRSPQAKIIIILRDPVQRAYAQYLMDFNEGVTDLDFFSALQRDWMRADKGWGVSQLYVELGLYHDQIQRYFSLFTREHVAVLLLEDLTRRPLQVLENLAAFLELSPMPFQEIDFHRAHNHYARPRGNWARRLAGNPLSRTVGEYFFPQRWGEYIWRNIFLREEQKPAIDPRAKAWLINKFRPEVERLELLLQRPLPELRRSWPDTAAPNPAECQLQTESHLR
ncbi:sulfotransferase [Acidithiobacillus sp. IBUN Pt1247-S3]|uniref:sulfotransferase family protein n=1 Tax=Acidithiobacillus sp. IBUN Pt1247-S3 TaxID=3166642 RepID=UPI0034E5B2FD